MEFTYTGKVSRAIGKSYTISIFCLNSSSLRTLYYSPVCPYLFYCVSLCASTYPSNLLQKRVVRIMSRSAFNDHTDPSFKNIGILNLESTVYPLQTKTVIQRPAAPWYSEEIATEKTQRRKLERRWRHSGLLTDRQAYVTQYLLLKNLIFTT